MNREPRSLWKVGILPVTILACLFAVIVAPTTSPARTVAGLLLMLALPGVALSDALLPELRAAELWICLVISVALSLVVTSACALVLALLEVPLSSPAVPAAVAAISLVANISSTVTRFVGQAPPPRADWMVIPAATLLIAGTLAAIWIGRIGDPVATQPFTVFSATGLDGTVESLASASDCSGLHVILSVASHEDDVRTYELWEASTGAAEFVKTIRLSPGESKRIPLTLPVTPDIVGKVTFELRVDDDRAAYRSLSLCASQGR